MKAFLAVSVAPGVDVRSACARDRIAACRCRRRPRPSRATGGSLRRRPMTRTPSAIRLMASLCGLPGRPGPDRQISTHRRSPPCSATAAVLDGAGLAGLLPPFAAAHWAGPGRPVVLAGDWLGLRQLYWWQGDGVAAVSTSAPALAALAGAGFDESALCGPGADGLAGGARHAIRRHHQARRRLCGRYCRAARYACGDTSQPRLAIEDDLPLPVVVDRMAQILRAINSSYVDDHPDDDAAAQRRPGLSPAALRHPTGSSARDCARSRSTSPEAWSRPSPDG